MATKNWFDGVKLVADAKALFKKLAFANRPDRGGDLQTMQEIAEQFQALLKTFHKQTTTGSDGKDHTYYYNQATEQAIIDKINELLSSGALIDGVDAYIVGSWLWVEGNTKPVKHLLGKDGLKMQWHSNRLAWYFKGDPSYKPRFNSAASLEDLKHYYGASKVNTKAKEDERSIA